MIFGRNKEISKQVWFYLCDDQIETTYAYKYLGVDFYSHGYFEPSSGKEGTACMKPLMASLRKEAVVGVTSWGLKITSIQSLGAPNISYGAKIWGVGGGRDWKNSIGRFFRKAWGYKWWLKSKCVLRHPTLDCWLIFVELPMESHALK